MHRSCVCVNFIAEHTRAKEDATKVCPGETEDFVFIRLMLFCFIQHKVLKQFAIAQLSFSPSYMYLTFLLF